MKILFSQTLDLCLFKLFTLNDEGVGDVESGHTLPKGKDGDLSAHYWR